jgi:ribosomal protein S18 acetylase RimI-like enzyme
VHIRPATPGDVEFVVGLTPRFVDFELPAGRDPVAVQEETARVLREAVTGTGDVFVAEEDGTPLGFVFLETRADLHGGERAHVSDLAVAATAEGRGVASALLAHADRWAAERDLRRIGLSAMVTNHRATGLYERLGFARETVTLTKSL